MQLEIDALKEAAAWPGADRRTPVAARQAATSAFDHGLSVGCVVAGAVAVAGALLAGAFLPAQPPQPPGPEHHPAGLAAPAGGGKDLVR